MQVDLELLGASLCGVNAPPRILFPVLRELLECIQFAAVTVALVLPGHALLDQLVILPP